MMGIAELLREGPLNLDDLAGKVGANQPSLLRFLRFLVGMDILEEQEPETFVATAKGAVLDSSHPQSVYTWAILLGDPIIWRPWGELYGSVVTGRPAFDQLYGESFFSHLERSPADARIFNAAMSDDSNTIDISDRYDFSGFTRIVDVGGGQGGLLQSILERNAQANGVLFDLRSVVTTAHELRDSTVASRIEFIEGDMFKSVPAGGDAYLLKRIIHDWSDSEATLILRNCRGAMASHGKVLLVERVVETSELSADLMMLVLVTGRERTEAEYRILFQEAGLTLARVIPAGEYSILEGIPG